MKKIFGFIFLIFAMTSCYDDYVKDFTYDSTYFAYQYDVRTLVVGEGMSIDCGVALGGVRSNNRDRIVEFSIDPTLITPDALTAMKNSTATYIKNAVASVNAFSLLPKNYFMLSDTSKFVIFKGQNTGRVTFVPDSARFLSDPNSLLPNYVLPLVIKKADVDTVLITKKYTLIAIKYENMLFGNYWHGGAARVERPGKTDTIANYFTNIPSSLTTQWALKTTGPFELTSNNYGNVTAVAIPQIKLSLNNATGEIALSGATGSTINVVQNGTCVFNKAKLLQDRKIFLKYSYKDSKTLYTYHATDTLTFCNRIRDGVNEWQDENPSHYN